MIEVLELIFHSFWTFIGTLFLIAVLGDFVHDFISAFIPKTEIHNHYDQVKQVEETEDE